MPASMRMIVRALVPCAILAVMGTMAADAAAGELRLREGDPAVCGPIMERLAEAEPIAPRIASMSLDVRVGDFEKTVTRAYITRRKMPAGEFDRRVRLRDWIGLLGEIPPDAETTPAIIHNEPALAPYVARCPDLFNARDRDGYVWAAPEWIAILDADIDNDGTVETLVQRQWIWAMKIEKLDRLDLDTCTLHELLWSDAKLVLFRLDGTTYLAERTTLSTSIYRPEAKSRPIDYDHPLCHIVGRTPLGDLPIYTDFPYDPS